MMMASVVSFRPTDEETEILERTRKSIGAKNRSEAVRYLIKAGAKRAGPLSEDPVWKVRAPRKYWLKKSLTSREIDEELAGGRR